MRGKRTIMSLSYFFSGRINILWKFGCFRSGVDDIQKAPYYKEYKQKFPWFFGGIPKMKRKVLQRGLRLTTATNVDLISRRKFRT
jgi:hypothetical protein